MNKEDYKQYYINGSDHYLIPKYVFNELFQEMCNWREECKQLKDNWNKLKNIAKSQSDFKQKLGNDRVYFEIDELLDKMQELEKGDSNE